MKTKKLKTKITNFICKQGDIFGEVDKNDVIYQIFENYNQMFGSEYLDWISNDLTLFIGVKLNLEKNNREGLHVWNELDKQTTNKDKTGNKTKIIKVFHEIPLYYLLAFSGNSFYKMNYKLYE